MQGRGRVYLGLFDAKCPASGNPSERKRESKTGETRFRPNSADLQVGGSPATPTWRVRLASSSRTRLGLRGTAGVRKNSAWLTAGGILPHSGNHPNIQFNAN